MLAQSTDHASKNCMVYALLKDRSATATMSMMWNTLNNTDFIIHADLFIFHVSSTIIYYILCTLPWPVPVDILSNNMTKMTMYAQAKARANCYKVIII